MSHGIHDREILRKELIAKVGPWAFQSYSKDRWKDVSDRELIVGTLLNAKYEDRHLILELFDIEVVRKIWDRYVVIQDDWFHESNLWTARNIFNAEDPEKFIKDQLRISRKLHMGGAPGLDI